VALLSLLLKEPKVEISVCIAKKYSLTATATLNDMVRAFRYNDAGDSRHEAKTPLKSKIYLP
jgi:hypothetical protein